MSDRAGPEHLEFLNKRIEYLEGINRVALEALELAATLSNFERPINRFKSPINIFQETDVRVKRIIPLQASAFYLVNEDSAEFKQALCLPEAGAEYIQKQVDFLIQNRTLAWVISRNRPVIVSDEQGARQLLLHTLATSSRVRGVFVGILEAREQEIPDLTLSVFRILIQSSAQLLESYELYKWVDEVNRRLTDKLNQLAFSEGKLLRSELLLKDAQAITQTGCWEYAAESGTTTWSEEFFRLLGYAPGEVPASFETFFEHIHPEDRPGLEHGLDLFDPKQPSVVKECRVVTRDGQEKQVAVQAVFDVDETGSLVYVRGTVQDITLRRQAEQDKEKLLLQLQRSEKMETIGMLAGGVAHDLNNILGAIVGYPDLLLSKLPEDSPMKKPLLSIRRSGERAASIVSDLLTLARRSVNVSEVININDIVTEYLSTPEFLKLQEYHPKVMVDSNLEAALMNVTGSPIHLQKVVMNLVSNAAEAIPDTGGVTVSTSNVTLAETLVGYDQIAPGEYARLSVSDTGQGIPEKDLRKIFEPFYTKKVMGLSGTGLGMAVVWGTVKDHKGFIDIISRKDRGTTFNLYFPVTREEAVLTEKLPQTQQYLGAGERVLVVDDVEEQRELAVNFLQELNYCADAVSSGEQAVAYIMDHPVDLVLLDMIMDPGIDGLETYRKILSLKPDQKAIIVSGYTETERVKEAERLGAGLYIKKPYTLEKIGIGLKAVLGK